MINIISLHSAPRSGSTWLNTIFNSHPHIKTCYQPLFSYKYKNIINENSTSNDFNIFINNLLTCDDDFINMNAEYHGNYPKYEKNDINTVFLKNVHHHHLIEKFIELNNNIKIIGLNRNPINVINSQMNASKEKLKDWLNGTDKNISEEYFFGFNKWLEINKMFINIKNKYPNNIIIVNYENIINDTENEIKKICDFCNLNFHENMRKCIIELKSKSSNYDYSVYKNIERSITLNKDIKKYILKYI